MHLYRLKPGKALRWPAEFTPVPEGHLHTRRGLARFKETHRVERGAEGFVVDLDAPGEDFFCGDDLRFLEPVPRDEVAEAEKAIAEQGPITFEPALDYLAELGVRAKIARPEPVEEPEPVVVEEPEVVEADEPEVPDRAEVVELCEQLGIEVGRRHTKTLWDEAQAALAQAVEDVDADEPEGDED